MKKELIEVMLKVSLSKIIKRGKKKEKYRIDDHYVIIQKEYNQCSVYVENEIGKENRKLPQFIKKYIIPRCEVESLILILNNAYLNKPLENGKLVKTVLKNAYINLYTNEKEGNVTVSKSLFPEESIQIDDVVIIDGNDELYKFREKQNTVNNTDESKKFNLEIKFKNKRVISIIRQSYEEVMYNSYVVYYKEGNSIKEVICKKNYDGKYISSDKKLMIDPTTMRIINLRVRESGNIGIYYNRKLLELVYAKPIIE